MDEDVAVLRLARYEAVAAFVVVPLHQRGGVLAHLDAVRDRRHLGRDGDRSRRIDFDHLHDLPALRAAHAGAHDGCPRLEILMPGLSQCRYMQERVAVIAVEGQEPIALYGVEPLNFTTQLNRSAVPARLSQLGRHSTIPCLLCENLNSPGSRCNSPCCVFVAYSLVQVGNFPTSWIDSKRLREH